MAGSSAPVTYWAVRTNYPLWRLAFGCQAVAIPSGEAVSQDALNGAAVELFENPRAHAKSFQPPEGEEALSRPLHNCVDMCGP